MMIFKIAKNDLRNLFYSPVAWFLTIAFWVQTAYFYMNALLPKAKWQDIALRNSPDFDGYGMSFTQSLFLSKGGVFDNILSNLYLFVPLLTMDLISREINNGSIKLLYSSPIRTRDIVFGKYMAIATYNLVLVGIVGVFMLTGYFNIHSADYGLLLSALLGFYLLVCAYTAIGLFMSSLTTYPIVSAIGSFIIVLILGRIGTLWQQFDFVRDLTYFLSISGRTGKMLVGLITSKDVIYFLIVIYLFVGFTWIRLQSAREYRSRLRQFSRYIAVIISALLMGYISSRPAAVAYWDTTAGQLNTIGKNTQEIIRSMKDDKLEVTLYTNLFAEGAPLGFPQRRNDYLTKLWEPYVRFKPDIDFHYVYYYDLAPGDSMLYRRFPGKNIDEIAKEVAYGFEVSLTDFLKPEEIRQKIDLQPERNAVVMQLSYNGKTTFLRTFIDNFFWPRQAQVAAAFKRLLQPKMPKVYYTTGHLERSIFRDGPRDYTLQSSAKGSRSALINNGFDVDTIALGPQDIPQDAEIVVLADPKTALDGPALDLLKQYIDRGGNMLIVGEPGKQGELNPLLAHLGLEMTEGTLAQVNKSMPPDYSTSYIRPAAIILGENTTLMGLRQEWDTVSVMMPSATTLVPTDSAAFRITPLLMTEDNKAWLKMGKFVTDSVPPKFNEANGDIRDTAFMTVAGLTRSINGKEQRIVVCSDADFISNRYLQGSRGMGEAFISWMNYNEFPVYERYSPALDDRLTLSYSAAVWEKTVYLWIIPGILLLAGTVLLVRRKRQ